MRLNLVMTKLGILIFLIATLFLPVAYSFKAFDICTTPAITVQPEEEIWLFSNTTITLPTGEKPQTNPKYSVQEGSIFNQKAIKVIFNSIGNYVFKAGTCQIQINVKSLSEVTREAKIEEELKACQQRYNDLQQQFQNISITNYQNKLQILNLTNEVSSLRSIIKNKQTITETRYVVLNNPESFKQFYSSMLSPKQRLIYDWDLVLFSALIITILLHYGAELYKRKYD